MQNISLVQTRGNPARRRDLRRLDITRYRCLCMHGLPITMHCNTLFMSSLSLFP